ncbi:SipW-dependent-type signal peptide-containing protein [Halapricum hydrolyticum]|uniref:SipW-dependent-type signal peptide-containing protein n=1 Tax=Halapricum hydrolyticum TaxID=2979991 RepID=A0AAE3I9J4_9EURY|nr:SipW-dependent-type signal peptide-containing protein [Halapricum hydrolyticum]MCU4718189.1 SipW-dependent-type signal peptide-containing protein [Halapricum hydrolyticum]MCU4726370.1 SipW-dependent-type signal peptide-containing protein [Halapricum hydrolyticum]
MSEKYELSRRKALGGLATIGLAGAGAGLGTSAYFSDEESFANNELTAGELDLVVDYWTSVDQGSATGETGSTTGSGRIQGEGSAVGEYQIADVKPGDSGKLVFCPKIVDNPAWLWAGSTGFTQYENGYTEPEGDVEEDEIDYRDGSDYTDFPVPDDGPTGEGFGELADNIQVTVAYCEPSDDLEGAPPEGPDDFETVRELENPDDYTLADLLSELQTGYLLDGLEESDGEWMPTDDGAYPGSPDFETQTGQCICIDWEVPTEVGNVIQTDSVEFDIGFAAEQARHNEDPQTPFATVVSSDTELKTALDDGETVIFADDYSDSIPEVERTTTISPSGNPYTYDVFDINTSGSGLDLGSEGDFRQYGYIGEYGQLRVAAGYVNPNTNVLRIFVNQGEDDNPLYIVVTDQPDDDSSITPLGSDPVYVAKVDASISP